MGSLNKSQTFDWPKLFIGAESGPNRDKIWFSRVRSSVT